MGMYEGRKNRKVIAKLIKLGACHSGCNFASNFSSWQEVWDACKKAEWLLWLLCTKSKAVPNKPAHRQLMLCQAEIFATVAPLYGDDEDQILGLVNELQLYGTGQINIGDISIPRDIHSLVYGDLVHIIESMARGKIQADSARLELFLIASDICDKVANSLADRSDSYSQRFSEHDAKLADIVRKYYPQAPSL